MEKSGVTQGLDVDLFGKSTRLVIVAEGLDWNGSR
jgi:hypothetical protein